MKAEFFRQVETFCAETTKNAELVLNRARTRENLRTLQTFVAQLAKQEKIGIHVNYDFVSYITPREFLSQKKKRKSRNLVSPRCNQTRALYPSYR